MRVPERTFRLLPMRATAQVLPSSFPEALKAARKERGWSQPMVARQLGIAESNIRNWEKGRNLPSFPLYEKLCALFGWSLPYSVGPHNPGYHNPATHISQAA